MPQIADRQGMLADPWRVVLLVLTVAAYWLVCFAPYDWVAPVSYQDNDAQRRPVGVAGEGAEDAEGANPTLVFGGAGIADVPMPDNWQATLKSLVISLRVRCTSADQSGPARVLTLSNDSLERNFMLGQDGADLVIRLRRGGSSINGTPNFPVSGFFADCLARTITVALTPERLSVREGNRLLLQETVTNFADWAPDFPLRLGNEGSWDRGWAGEISALSIEVNEEAIEQPLLSATIPQGAWLVSKRVQDRHYFTLVPFSNPNPYFRSDIILNVLGFIPFGLLLAFGWGRRLTQYSAGFCAALLSGSIELGQFGFVGRFPSTTDLCTNTAGGIVGFALGLYLLGRWKWRS